MRIETPNDIIRKRVAKSHTRNNILLLSIVQLSNNEYSYTILCYVKGLF